MAYNSGELLVREGLVSRDQLEEAQRARAGRGGTVSEYLVSRRYCDDEELTEFYRTKLLIRRIHPNALLQLPSELTDCIPREMAVAFRALPIASDAEGNLTIVVSDPADQHGVDEIGFHTGKYVIRTVATQLQLAWGLAHYYGAITELGQTLLGSQSESKLPKRKAGLTGQVQARRKQVLVPGAEDDDDGEIELARMAALAEADDRRLREKRKREQEQVAKLSRRREPAETMQELMPQWGEVKARSETEAIPLAARLEEALPAVVVSDQEPVEPAVPEAAAAEVETPATEPAAPAAPSYWAQSASSAAVAPEIAPSATAHDTIKTPALVAEASPTEEAPREDAAPQEALSPGILDQTKPLAIVTQRQLGTESAPILLTRRTQPDLRIPEGESVILLERPKRAGRETSVGVGDLSPVPPGMGDAQSGVYSEPDGPGLPYSTDPPQEDVEDVSKKRNRKSRKKRKTEAPAESAPEATRKKRTSSLDPSPVDDGWDLGDDAPVAAPAEAPATAKKEEKAKEAPAKKKRGGKGKGKKADAKAEAEETAEAEPASAPVDVAEDTARLTDTVQQLNSTDDRNAVFSLLLDYMSHSHQRVAFFAVKKGNVCAWKHKDLSGHDESAAVAIDASATFQSVTGGKNHRGPIEDAATQDFIKAALGAPAEDVLAAPVSIGDRVIGVLCGDGPTAQLFDQQLDMVTRTAGLALLRIINAKKKAG